MSSTFRTTPPPCPPRSQGAPAQHDAPGSRDFWCRDDLDVLCHNLVEAAAGTHRWKTWPVDRTDFTECWA